MLIFGNTETAEQRLQRAAFKILAHPQKKYGGIQGVLLYGNVTVDDTIPTACTDGRNERYGRKFVETLTDPELRFLRLHETYHKMYRHLTTWQWMWKENARLANQACDYVINVKLVDTDAGEGFIKMPKAGLLDTQYRGMDAGQVYKILKKNQEDQPSRGRPGDTGEGFDSHDWESASELTKEEIDQIGREIDDALRQGKLLAGKEGSGGMRDINELMQCKVDWREVVRDWLNTQQAGRDYLSWRRFNRRGIGSDQYLPSGVQENIGEIVFGIDASGSIDARFLSQFLGEIKGALEALHPEKVHVLYWDTKVCRHETYTAENLDDLIRTTKPEGGGGTDPRCVVGYIEENALKPECVLMLTDGYVGSWGNWNVPVLWCIADNKNASPDVGQTVHIDI